jgi:hypothetical protein
MMEIIKTSVDRINKVIKKYKRLFIRVIWEVTLREKIF